MLSKSTSVLLVKCKVSTYDLTLLYTVWIQQANQI